MGYFDGVAANLFRHDPAGRRYYAPLGKCGPLFEVPDTAVPRMQREWRAFYQVMFLGMLALGIATGWSWRLLYLAPLAGLLAVPYGRWVARGLARSATPLAALVRVSPGEALTRSSRAVGRKVLTLVLVSSALMTAVGLWAALTTGTKTMWFSAGFFALCTLSIASQWRRAGGHGPDGRNGQAPAA